MKDYSYLLPQLSALAVQVAHFINEQRVQAHQIEQKSINSLVSFVDKGAEEIIIKGLKSMLPAASILAEESAPDHPWDSLMWVIDPLDGTTNYLHGLPFYAISIALVADGKSVIGIVHDVVHNDSYTAALGKGSYCNGVKLSVSNNPKLSDSFAATGFPYYDFDKMEAYLECFRYFMKNTRGIRRIGSAALDLAYVAAGKFDFFWEYKLQTWDIAAGTLLVQEAGGIVSEIDGGDQFLKSGHCIASSPQLHPEILEIIKTAFETN